MSLTWWNHEDDPAVTYRGSPTDRLEVDQPQGSTSVEDQAPKFLAATRSARVERVSVYPVEEGKAGKSLFFVSLELDNEPDPSNLHRRTERVLSLELEIEEKELTALARLSGRGLVIHYSRRTTEVQFEALQNEILRLQEENLKLRNRKNALEEQLQFAIDQNRVS